jgi:hypothetical protein
MNDRSIAKVHWSFWVITIFMLIWNALGCVNFIVQMNPDMVSSYRESEQAIIQGRPLWATTGFATAAFGGALGCILLLLRKSFATYLFVASLAGVFIAVIHSLTTGAAFSIGEIIGIIVMPIAVAVFLVWYSKYGTNRGWLNAT